MQDRAPEAGWRRLGRFLGLLGHRFASDGCFNLAAALSYASLFALVPLGAIVLLVLSSIPAFQALTAEAERALFAYLAPNVGDDARSYIAGFVANSDRLTAFGLIGLVISAVAMMATIEDAFNAIWRVPKSRRIGGRLVIYAVALLVGPLLVGGAVSLSALFFAAADRAGIAGLSDALGRALTLLLTVSGFALIYFALPNRPVRIAHALSAAISAGILFEVIKAGFGVYVRLFPAYETLYGALSVLPLFLIWMYLAWVVVLLGAELAALWGEREREQLIKGH